MTQVPRWPRALVHSRTRLLPSGVESVQWLRVAGAALPRDPVALEALLREVDRAYGLWIERFTAGCVRILTRASGGKAAAIEPFGWPVGLELSPARVSLERREVEREILSGWLVGSRSGTLAQGFREEPGAVVAFVRIESFRPSLLRIGPVGAWLYDTGQSVAHRRLSRAFLRGDVAPRLLATRSG